MITSRVSVYGLSTRTVRTLCRKLGLSSVDCGLEGSDHLLGILAPNMDVPATMTFEPRESSQ